MLERIKFETSSIMAHVQVRTQEEIDREEEERRARLMRALQAQHAEAGSLLAAAGADEAGALGAPGAAAARGVPLPAAPEAVGTFVRAERKVGRNEPCPCGSGKKYKHCHGTLTSVE
jgi:preprotein translocase subunit SecA